MSFDTNIITGHVISVFFYLMIAIFTITSAVAIYSLIRYGKDKLVVVSVSTIYIVIAVTLVSLAMQQYHQIQFN